MHTNTSLHHEYSLADILGKSLSHQEALERLKAAPETYRRFQSFPPPEQERLLDFIQGNRGLKILNDDVFYYVMNPTIHPDRLSSMLSAILKEEVTVQKVLPRKGLQMEEKGSLVVMDILVELSNGITVNVEVQRLGYLFPGERSSCYLSDLVMRQYNLVRQKKKKHFSYKDMKPIILIVLMEKSPKEFAPAFPHYIHQEVHTFDSGAAMKSLTKIIYISIDNFHFVVQNISNKQDAWLTFLSSDAPADILKLINAYPEFLEYYQDIAEFRRHPKELMLMNIYYKRSKALAMMDRNTEIYMMELMQEEAKQMQEEKQHLQKETKQMAKQNAELTDTVAALESNYSNLTNDYATLQEKFSAALAEIDRLTKANSSATS